ncbi:response regulator [Niastella populi]|uniref:Response regulatory domain-containing protein n=1 Tax=Niastella populi TaxID=550983 RepID=A0A1V9GAV9_9BACT|nr:response regulator [Niastella populi]OQP67684.1 hypothetical protein A4R26_11515 [Niastella populi]
MFPSRIVLIDDDQDDGYIFDLALKHLPWEIQFQHIQDSDRALAILSEKEFTPPDMLFLDWNMPKFDGKQCLLRIRAIPGYDLLPIVICST